MGSSCPCKAKICFYIFLLGLPWRFAITYKNLPLPSNQPHFMLNPVHKALQNNTPMAAIFILSTTSTCLAVSNPIFSRRSNILRSSIKGCINFRLLSSPSPNYHLIRPYHKHPLQNGHNLIQQDDVLFLQQNHLNRARHEQ